MVIKMIGKLKFEPQNKTKKHEKQDWKKVAMIMLKCDIDNYYSWFIKKRFSLDFVKALRGPHITIISDKVDSLTFQNAINKYNGKDITFYVELEPRTNTKHWWLRVHCPESEEIRREIGLDPSPYFGLHLTIGYVNEKYLEHSKYILDVVRKFGFISSESKKPLETHEVFLADNSVKISTLETPSEFEYNGNIVYYKNGSYTDIKNKVT